MNVGDFSYLARLSGLFLLAEVAKSLASFFERTYAHCRCACVQERSLSRSITPPPRLPSGSTKQTET
eukprot:5094728-Amphidinium_carterae.1